MAKQVNRIEVIDLENNHWEPSSEYQGMILPTLTLEDAQFTVEQDGTCWIIKLNGIDLNIEICNLIDVPCNVYEGYIASTYEVLVFNEVCHFWSKEQAEDVIAKIISGEIAEGIEAWELVQVMLKSEGEGFYG